MSGSSINIPVKALISKTMYTASTKSKAQKVWISLKVCCPLICLEELMFMANRRQKCKGTVVPSIMSCLAHSVIWQHHHHLQEQDQEQRRTKRQKYISPSANFGLNTILLYLAIQLVEVLKSLKTGIQQQCLFMETCQRFQVGCCRTEEVKVIENSNPHTKISGLINCTGGKVDGKVVSDF